MGGGLVSFRMPIDIGCCTTGSPCFPVQSVSRDRPIYRPESATGKVTNHITLLMGFCSFCQAALGYVTLLSIGTLSVGFGLSFYAAGYESLVSDLDLDTTMLKSIFNALTPLGGILGGVFVNMAITKLGRRYACLISSLIVLAGYICIAATKRSYRELAFVGRALSGVGIGAVSTVTPVYIAELSPIEHRGSYGVMNQLFTSIGVLLMYFFGIWTVWRPLAGIAMAPPAILALTIKFIPDSPVDKQLRSATSTESHKELSGDRLCSKKYVKALIIAFLVVVFQQFSGINALVTNLNPIFLQSKVNLDSAISSTIVSASQVFTVACSTPLVEKLGRRKTWMVSALGQSIFLLVLWANERWPFATIVPIIFLFLDVLAFGLGLGPIPWFVVPEMFPDTVRSLATALVQAVNWFLCALMVFVFPTMQEQMTLGWVYFFYGMVMLISVFFAIFVLPETRGKEMGDISEQPMFLSSESDRENA